MRVREFVTAAAFGLGIFVVAGQINAKTKMPDPWEAGQSNLHDARMADWQQYHVFGEHGPLAGDDSAKRHS